MTQMCFFNQCIDFTLRDFLFEAVKFNKYAGTDKGKCGYSSKVLDLAQNQIFYYQMVMDLVKMLLSLDYKSSAHVESRKKISSRERPERMIK